MRCPSIGRHRSGEIMTIGGILSSPTQRRFLILISVLLIILCFVAVFVLYLFTVDTRGWNILVAFFCGNRR